MDDHYQRGFIDGLRAAEKAAEKPFCFPVSKLDAEEVALTFVDRMRSQIVASIRALRIAKET